MKNKIRRIYEILYTFFKNLFIGIVPHCFYKKIISDDSDVVVSFTSYGDRIRRVLPTVKSLFLQKKVKFKAVILWISFEDQNKVPKKLLKFEKRGLEIKYCRDYKSYKKILETSRIFSEYNIITIDDDVIYPSNHFSELIATSKEYPNCVCVHRAHLMTFSGHDILKYSEWKFGSEGIKGPSHLLVGIGYQGILYPAKFFSIDDFPYDVIEMVAPRSDDLWLKFLELQKGIKVVKVFKKNRFLASTYSTQKNALTNSNVIGSGNDEAIENLCKTFQIKLDDFALKE